MIKWFAYIVLFLIFASCLSYANTIKIRHHVITFSNHELHYISSNSALTDTLTAKKTKQQQEEEKKKVKEIAKAKRQLKPEKIDEQGVPKVKPKRERRPEGLERPPEIPRRNGN
ncbi:MAG: hypothetical protein JWQ06_976 [Mucilaginibacter sp.]|nr:hypothetical protein [Mucilaginibacter sp.]